VRECQIFDAGVSDTSFDRDCEARIQVPRKGSKKIPKPSRRTRIVWVSFLGSMAAVIGLLALGDRRPGPGFPAAHASLLADSPAGDRIFQTDIPLGPNRWKAIVIHHSGEPGGDPESIRRQHLSYGARAMGYHFLVGNGDRRRFTDRQITQLISLVRRLQRQLDLPPSAVRLHRDVAPGLTRSPGIHFPSAVLDQQVVNPIH
jgi:hypothetical protein